MMRAAVEAARADKGQGGAPNPTTQPRGGRHRSTSRWGAPNGATTGAPGAATGAGAPGSSTGAVDPTTQPEPGAQAQPIVAAPGQAGRGARGKGAGGRGTQGRGRDAAAAAGAQQQHEITLKVGGRSGTPGAVDTL
eukprot:4071090-Pleurochrysis_carterae.AAC.1